MLFLYSFKIFTIFKIFIVFVCIAVSVNMTYAQSTVPFTARAVGAKRSINPQKLILIKITPKISDPIKFLQSTEVLFLDELKLNQTVFSYVVIGNKVYKMRDLDQTYSSNSNDNQVAYIAYTTDLPLQLISDLKSVYDVKEISTATISFSKNIFNINETKATLPALPEPKVKPNIQFLSVKYEQKPDPGSLQTVTVKFKNNSDYPIIKSDPSNLIVITSDKKDRASAMYVNDRWYSKSRAGNLVENRISGGEIGTITFPIVVNVEAGAQKEKFILGVPDGSTFDKSDFEVSVSIPNKNQKLVQVKENSYGFALIKEQKNYNSTTVGFANTNTKLLSISESNGWINVKFQGDKEGWILSSSVKKLN